MAKFQNLKRACNKYPEIELRVKDKPKVYAPPKGRAKDGFINMFCK